MPTTAYSFQELWLGEESACSLFHFPPQQVKWQEIQVPMCREQVSSDNQPCTKLPAGESEVKISQ